MFCSSESADAAHDTYHSIECPIIDNLLALAWVIHLMALRTIFKGVLAFGSLTKVGEFLDEHGKTKVDAFSAVPEGMYENSDQQKFHQVRYIQYKKNELNA